MASQICILDDDPKFLRTISEELAESYTVRMVGTSQAFWNEFVPGRFDLIVLDMRLAREREGMDVLREVLRIDPLQQVAIATAYPDTETYLAAIQEGALIYLDKARVDPHTLALLFDATIQQGRLKRDCAASAQALERINPLEIVGSSGEARRLRAEIDRLSSPVLHRCPVLIAGETGCGRELVARNLHARAYPTTWRPMAIFSARGLPDEDCIRILLGGVFSNRRAARRGLLEDAHGGSLLVRDADTLSPRVLKTIYEAWSGREFLPAGDYSPRPLDARLFMTVGRRMPIMDSLNPGATESMDVSPLRERKEDVVPLALHFLDSLVRLGRDTPTAFSPEVANSLLSHHWPGNIAELRAAVEYAAVRAKSDGDTLLEPKHLPLINQRLNGRKPDRLWNLDYQEKRVQVEMVDAAIRELVTSNKTTLAKFLGIGVSTTLTRRMARCLEEYPDLANEFPATAKVFPSSSVPVN